MIISPTHNSIVVVSHQDKPKPCHHSQSNAWPMLSWTLHMASVYQGLGIMPSTTSKSLIIFWWPSPLSEVMRNSLLMMSCYENWHVKCIVSFHYQSRVWICNFCEAHTSTWIKCQTHDGSHKSGCISMYATVSQGLLVWDPRETLQSNYCCLVCASAFLGWIRQRILLMFPPRETVVGLRQSSLLQNYLECCTCVHMLCPPSSCLDCVGLTLFFSEAAIM